MLRVYVAGCFFHKERFQDIATALRLLGCTVVSGWMDRGRPDPTQRQAFADKDLEELASADMLVAVMDEKEYDYRGTFTEIGFALGQGKSVIIVCPTRLVPSDMWDEDLDHYCQNNVFFSSTGIAGIEHVKTVVDLYALIRGG
jgi:nucleoside 2-deoxyribosyltransferase